MALRSLAGLFVALGLAACSSTPPPVDGPVDGPDLTADRPADDAGALDAVELTDALEDQGEVADSGGADGPVIDVDPASGNLAWVREARGPGENYLTDVAFTPDGQVVILGLVTSNATLGAGEPNETMLGGGGSSTWLVLALLAADGNLVWARQLADLGPSSYPPPFKLAVAPDGSMAVVGTALTAPGQSILIDPQGSDPKAAAGGFVARLGTAGDLRWLRQLGTDIPDGARGASVSFSTDGSTLGVAALLQGTDGDTVVTTGLRIDTFDAASGAPLRGRDFASAYSPTLRPASDGSWRVGLGGEVGGLWGLAADLSQLWERILPPVRDIAVLADGAVVSTGTYSGPTTLGAGEPGETTLPADSTLFVAVHDATARLVWANSIGDGSVQTFAGAVTGTDNGAIVVTGWFEAPFSPMGRRAHLRLGDGPEGEVFLEAVQGNHLFIAGYDRTGAVRWARRAGHQTPDSGNYRPPSFAQAVAAAPGAILVGGGFDGMFTFGPGEAGETTLIGSTDAFVMQLVEP